MSLYSLISRFTSNHPLLIYALVWTVLLTITVAISSLSPEIAFMSAISPTSSFSSQQQHNQASCKIEEGYIRVPIDNPGEVLCFPAHLFVKSRMDYFVPPILLLLLLLGLLLLSRLWDYGKISMLKHGLCGTAKCCARISRGGSPAIVRWARRLSWD